jgi:hypothetical protein
LMSPELVVTAIPLPGSPVAVGFAAGAGAPSGVTPD